MFTKRKHATRYARPLSGNTDQILASFQQAVQQVFVKDGGSHEVDDILPWSLVLAVSSQPTGASVVAGKLAWDAWKEMRKADKELADMINPYNCILEDRFPEVQEEGTSDAVEAALKLMEDSRTVPTLMADGIHTPEDAVVVFSFIFALLIWFRDACEQTQTIANEAEQILLDN